MPHAERVRDCVQDVFVDIWRYRYSMSETVVVKAYLLASVRRRIARLNERDTVFRQTTSLGSDRLSLRYTLPSKTSSLPTKKRRLRLRSLTGSLTPCRPGKRKPSPYATIRGLPSLRLPLYPTSTTSPLPICFTGRCATCAPNGPVI